MRPVVKQTRNLSTVIKLVSERAKRMEAKGTYDSRRIGWRHVLMGLIFFGSMCKQATRVGLSVAMVAMVRPAPAGPPTNDTPEVACPDNRRLAITNPSYPVSNVSTQGASAQFDWDSQTQGILHGAFYYGYLFSQLPGGVLAHRVGSTRPIALCSLLIGLLTFLSPLAANTGFWLLFGARLIVGVCTGVTLPSVVHLWSEWSPPLERGRLISGAGSGSQLGTVIGMSVSGLLAATFGWESVFYCFGTLDILWVIPWVILARDSPRNHPRISAEERAYILTSLGKEETHRRHAVPWMAIVRTGALYAVLAAEFAHNWGFYTILTNLPTYLHNIQHYALKKNGFLSALPYLVRWAAIFAVAGLGDWLLTRGLVRRTLLRSTFTGVSFLLTAAALVGVGYAGCDSTLAVALLVVTVGVQSLNSSGYFLGYSDMSPEFAGILVGMGNGFGTTTGILAPYVAGVLTNGPGGHSVANWRIVFLIAAGLYVGRAIVYWVFGSAELQPWDPSYKRAHGPEKLGKTAAPPVALEVAEYLLEEKVAFIPGTVISYK